MCVRGLRGIDHQRPTKNPAIMRKCWLALPRSARTHQIAAVFLCHFPQASASVRGGFPHTTSALCPQNLLTVRPTVRNISRPPSLPFCHSVRISYMEAPIERASLRSINHAGMGPEESAVHIGYAVNTWRYRVH